VSIQGAFESLRAFSEVAHFTDTRSGTPPASGFTMIMFGHYIMPR
jgi:hypothetical protein